MRFRRLDESNKRVSTVTQVPAMGTSAVSSAGDDSGHRLEVGSLAVDPPCGCDVDCAPFRYSIHHSSGLYSTRLETRTKESSRYASRTVLTRLVGRSERNCWDVNHLNAPARS